MAAAGEESRTYELKLRRLRVAITTARESYEAGEYMEIETQEELDALFSVTAPKANSD